MQQERALNSAFRFLAWSIVLLLTVPMLFRDGMFMDAMLYTCVSHNQAHDIGSFWFPVFSEHGVAGLSTFHEQPPLVFWIQSLFFRALGDSMYTERIYTLCMILLTMALIGWYWRWLMRKDESYRKMEWLPLIFWMTIPVCFWSYSQNQHENSMTIFVLAGAVFLQRAMEEKEKSLRWTILGGSMVFLASMIKGLPGLFPLGIPFFHWLIVDRKEFGRMFLISAGALLTILLIYASLVLISDDARESLRIYFFDRALKRIDSLPTVDNRFYIVGRLLNEILIPAVLAALIWLLTRKNQSQTENSFDRRILFFMVVGFSGSLPLMLTLVQKGFYFVPSLPFFAIGFALVVFRPLNTALSKMAANAKTVRVLRIFSFVLLISVPVITVTQIGKFSRDADTLHDVYAIGPILEKEKKVAIPGSLWNDWSLQTYLMRYYFVSSVTSEESRYFIKSKELGAEIPEGFSEKEMGLKKYQLFERKDP